MFLFALFPTEYIALYPYSSVEPGDLTFSEGEEILVTQKDGEWWTGSIGDRTGIFPSNYVKPKDQEVEFIPFCLSRFILKTETREYGFGQAALVTRKPLKVAPVK